MKPQLIPYTLMNVFGSILALVILILYTLFKKGKLKPKIFKIIWAIVGILILVYGIYQLSVANLLRTVYPGSYYTLGGWIAIFLGIIIFVLLLWEPRKK